MLQCVKVRSFTCQCEHVPVCSCSSLVSWESVPQNPFSERFVQHDPGMLFYSKTAKKKK